MSLFERVLVHDSFSTRIGVSGLSKIFPSLSFAISPAIFGSISTSTLDGKLDGIWTYHPFSF
jgi:hypothetical protein